MASSATEMGCCVVGGGPAGLVLGLILARAGVRTTVLEKHGDFLRDFRGDTVHASTLTLLDELGLGEQFAAIPPRWIERARVQFDSGTYSFGDLTRLPSSVVRSPDVVAGLHLAGGADLKGVMDRMGHAQIQTTQKYLHTLPDTDQKNLDALTRMTGRSDR